MPLNGDRVLTLECRVDPSLLTLPLLVLAGLVMLGLLLWYFRGRRSPYRLQPALFTEAERSFLGVLDQAAGQRYRILGKVRVADVIAVDGSAGRRKRQQAFNRISRKHFDFVLCEPSDLSVVCVLELDDRSHARRRRVKRDRFLEDVCSGIGLPLVRVEASDDYAVTDIASRVQQAILAGITTQTQEGVDMGAQGHTRVASSAHPATANGETAPQCPKCASPMRRMTARRGKHAGQGFWGCSTYPECRGTRKIA